MGTRICAIAARFHEKREDLHTTLSAYAKRLAFEVPSRGYKSVEVCQAYLLLSVWTLGPEKTYVFPHVRPFGICLLTLQIRAGSYLAHAGNGDTDGHRS